MPSIALPRAAARHARLPAIGPSLLAAATRILLWPARVLRARREYAILARLGEAELRDIGLTQADIIAVTGLPADADPTQHLARTVAERRAARR